MAEKKEKRYVSDNAHLMAEWDWEKNFELGFEPNKLTCGSGKKAWWKCSKGHEWEAVIASRTRGRGCPYCIGRKVLQGYNDLKTTNPALANEWNYEKNINLKPENISAGSNKKVWWKCHNGHEWSACIIDRAIGNGCPFCAGKKVLKGYNDLRTVNPSLAEEWNYEKNNELRPEDVTSKSDKNVWWKCNKGHEWQAIIYSRSYGSGCPVCNSERHASFPEYAFEYYLKNLGLQALHSYKDLGFELDIFIPSKRIAIEYDGYYWHQNKAKEDIEKNRKCEKNGVKLYRIREGLLPLNDSSIDYTIRKDGKDLTEALKKILSEIVGTYVNINIAEDYINIEKLREHTEKENSLLVCNPIVAFEWNYERNGNLRPENVTANSNKKVWWKCNNGHEWQATIANRHRGYGCPYCAGQKVLQGYNDLKTTNPTLASEWNYEKNINLKPENISAGSNKKVWWKCSKGHEWEATIKNRNRGHNCPYCTSHIISKNDPRLYTIDQRLVSEWNYEKNIGLSPELITPHSVKKVWWKCGNGHEWLARVDHRTNGSGCPYCLGQKVLQGYNDLQTVNPTLAKEWNHEKNNGVTPADVMPNSHKNVYWKCGQGHEYQMTIKDRNRGCICPECAKQKRKKKDT